ncbi:hypothetical protein ACJ41O_000324 [Fusarium nematophilum]
MLIKSSPLLLLARRKFLVDKSLAGAWELQVLDRLTSCSREVDHLDPKPMQSMMMTLDERSAAFIDDFETWIDHASLCGAAGNNFGNTAQFIPQSEIETFFNDEQRLKRLERLIRDSTRGSPRSMTILIKNTCAKISCILLMLRRWDLLPRFLSRPDLHDFNLPFESMPSNPPFNQKVWRDFCRLQWTFCTHPLSLAGDELSLASGHILPIATKSYLGVGGCAIVDKVSFHDNHLQVSNELAGVSQTPAVCAFKVLNTRHAHEYYRTELQAFKNLAEHPVWPAGIVRFFGAVISPGACGLFLEFADRGNLETYMREVPPPSSEADMRSLWTQLFHLSGAVDAVQSIHFQIKSGALMGWYQDLKPAKILVVSGTSPSVYGVAFKLGDFGLSFRQLEPSAEDIYDWDSLGTRLYGMSFSWFQEIQMVTLRQEPRSAV